MVHPVTIHIVLICKNVFETGMDECGMGVQPQTQRTVIRSA